MRLHHRRRASSSDPTARKSPPTPVSSVVARFGACDAHLPNAMVPPRAASPPMEVDMRAQLRVWAATSLTVVLLLLQATVPQLDAGAFARRQTERTVSTFLGAAG